MIIKTTTVTDDKFDLAKEIKSKGLTFQKVANKWGKSIYYLRRIAYGYPVSPEVAQKIKKSIELLIK